MKLKEKLVDALGSFGGVLYLLIMLITFLLIYLMKFSQIKKLLQF